MTRLLQIPHEQRPFDGEGVLIFYDGPQLLWLPVEGSRLLALGLPPEAGACPYLVAELTEDQAQALLRNEVTLRSLYQTATLWLLADYGADELTLEPVLYVSEDWLPGDVRLQLHERLARA